MGTLSTLYYIPDLSKHALYFQSCIEAYGLISRINCTVPGRTCFWRASLVFRVTQTYNFCTSQPGTTDTVLTHSFRLPGWPQPSHLSFVTTCSIGECQSNNQTEIDPVSSSSDASCQIPSLQLSSLKSSAS